MLEDFEACMSGLQHVQTRSTLTKRVSVTAIAPSLHAKADGEDKTIRGREATAG